MDNLNTPAFSVVMPLFNKARHVGAAIQSVLNQTVIDFELIVVDDGSTDGSGDIARLFIDERIRVVRQVNAGVSEARNRGIRESSADLIAFLDADDTWEVDFLSIISEMESLYPKIGTYATHVRNTQSPQLNFADYDPSRTDKYWMISNFFDCLHNDYYPASSSSVCIRREVLHRVGGFNCQLAIGEDIDMWIRAYLDAGILMANRYAATYNRQADNRSVHRVDLPMREIEFFMHLRNAYIDKNDGGSERLLLATWTASRIHQIAIRLAYRGRKAEAFHVLRKYWALFLPGEIAILALRLALPQRLIETIKKVLPRREIKRATSGTLN